MLQPFYFIQKIDQKSVKPYERKIKGKPKINRLNVFFKGGRRKQTLRQDIGVSKEVELLDRK
jgi:hypothetical protein